LAQTTFYLPDPADRSQDVHNRGNLQLSKIVATIGPTSEQEEPLRLVTDAGMRIMRLNFSHATKEEVELRITNLALAQVRFREKISINHLLDCTGKRRYRM
jgi:pyruvate kinase